MINTQKHTKIVLNDKIKKIIVYIAFTLYTLLIFLKNTMHFDLGYYELILVAIIGFLIRVSLGINPSEMISDFALLLSPQSKDKFNNILNLEQDLKTISSSLRINTEINIPYPETGTPRNMRFSDIPSVESRSNETTTDKPIINKDDSSFLIEINYEK